MEIGEVIVRLRKQKGVKQKELAAILGISASYLSLVEHNQHKPSMDLIAKIANYFDLPAASIFYMALNIDTINDQAQQKYFKAAKPIIDSVIEYLLSDDNKPKGNTPMAKLKHNLKHRKKA